MASGLCLYLVVRTLTEGGRAEALANAFALRRIEAELGIAWEAGFQAWVAGSEMARAYFAYVYVYGYWPVLAAVLVTLFVISRPHYHWLRNALLLSGALGLLVFAAFPVAPPRLSDPAIVDTIAIIDGGAALARPASLINQFAAMPSFHVGWILMVSVALAGVVRSRLVRAVCMLLPLQMAVAVVATGNHFVADVVVGCAVAVAALVVSGRLGGLADVGHPAEGPPQPAT